MREIIARENSWHESDSHKSSACGIIACENIMREIIARENSRHESDSNKSSACGIIACENIVHARLSHVRIVGTRVTLHLYIACCHCVNVVHL